MKYGDDLDRVPSAELSRRQFLTAGGQRAARLAAGVFLPAGRLVDGGEGDASSETGETSRERRES